MSISTFSEPTTEMGLVHTPSDAYDSIHLALPRPGQEHFLDDHGIQASADLGIANQGVFGGNMDE